MHYSYDVVVEPANIVTNNVEQSIKIGAGIIRHVSIIFPPGCVRMVRGVFWNQAEQLLPTNPEAYYAEDSYTVEADCYIPTSVYGNQFYFLAWNIGCNYKHLIRVLLDVQGNEEPDINQAATTLYQTVQSLVTVLKGFY